jgi:hypothetical protein
LNLAGSAGIRAGELFSRPAHRPARMPALPGLTAGSWSQLTSRFWRCFLSMNRRFGVPALAGPDRQKAGHRTGDPHPGRFLVPNARRTGVEAFHEPEREPSRFAAHDSLPKLRTCRNRLPLPTRCGRGPSAVRVASDREPSRFAAGCLARRHCPFPNHLGLPTRCGRGPSAVRRLGFMVPMNRPKDSGKTKIEAQSLSSSNLWGIHSRGSWSQSTVARPRVISSYPAADQNRHATPPWNR